MKTCFSILFLLFTGILFSQDLYLIAFTDKENISYYFDHPEEMLSQKALERRERFGIALDARDVPLEASQVEAIANTGVEIIGASKWFNGVFAWCTNAQISVIENLDFVMEVRSFANPLPAILPGRPEFFNENPTATNKTLEMNYNLTETQVTQINLQVLHEQGFTGEGMDIAMFDNGFVGVDERQAFAYIREGNRIKTAYNFVTGNENIYSSGSHGTLTLSTIGAYLENIYIGTAIDANFHLFVTENDQHEMPDEEVHWILAAEKADSLGIDVINSSLGYYDFDDPRYNYTYEDMDGKTTYISRGAQIAAEKGIMVVNSAGNEGSNSWHYLIAPSDAEDVFSIGAVDSSGYPTWFTSYGPSADQRIKPDVAALGESAAVIGNSFPTFANGTSFSSPIMAGALACLMQALPDSHPAEIRQKVRESAHLYNNPTDQLGYGIPDFGEAYQQLVLSVISPEISIPLKVYPNPAQEVVYLDTEEAISKVRLISFEGKIIRHFNSDKTIDLSAFPTGTYFLKVDFENGKTATKRIIKK